jgi:hypothetical protein
VYFRFQKYSHDRFGRHGRGCPRARVVWIGSRRHQRRHYSSQTVSFRTETDCRHTLPAPAGIPAGPNTSPITLLDWLEMRWRAWLRKPRTGRERNSRSVEDWPQFHPPELLEARVRAQERKMRAGIDSREIAVSGGICHRAAVVRFEEFAYSFSSKA